MGVCASSCLKVPRLGQIINGSELMKIMKDAGINTTNYQLFDDTYITVNYADFKNFADYACISVNKYKLESFDCDDYGQAMLGRCKEYYARCDSDYGTCIGFLTGDIKLKVGDPDRPHAVNFFLDENKKLFVYDAMWNNIYEWNKDSMTPWFWMC
jgi:hypothetical protein